MQATPNDYIGRGMKVGKEEIIGLIVALERAVSIDQDAELARWNARAQWLADQLQDIPGVSATYTINTSGYGDVDLQWDEAVIPMTSRELKDALRHGDPSLVYDGTTVRTRLLRDGEERLVADRLRQVLGDARRG